MFSLARPTAMTVTSVLDDEGCFANKNVSVFVVSLHIITICHLLTLGTDVLLVTVRSWHWPHVRLLLIPGSSASLGNHQLLYVLPAGRRHWLTEHLVGSPSDDIIIILFVTLAILACFVFHIILANFANITNNTHFVSWYNIANQWTR